MTASLAVPTTGRLPRPSARRLVALIDALADHRADDQSGWTRTARREQLTAAARSAAEQRDVAVTLDDLGRQPPTPVPAPVQRLVAAAEACGLATMHLPSGAEHDARPMATLGPMGMIFVPSAGGRSHSPEEWTEPEHLADGVHVLATAIAPADVTPRSQLEGDADDE